MGVLCDMLKFGSTAALDCCTDQNKGRYLKKELLLLLVSLSLGNKQNETFLVDLAAGDCGATHKD